MTTILVLDYPTHDIPTSEYAAALHERLLDAIVRHPETTTEALDAATDTTIIASTSLPSEVLDTADELRLFAGTAAGYNHFPLETSREHGVRVTNASSIHGPSIAGRVIGWLLMITHRLDEGLHRQQRREWRRFQSYGELQGSTATIVGLSAIKQAVVERLDAFDAETVGVHYTPEEGGPTDEILGFNDLESTLVRADSLVVAYPLTDEAHNLVDQWALSTLPERAVFVNVARGGTVDTDVLVSHLRGNRLRAVALSVADPKPLPEDHPFQGFKNVYITPHVSDHTPRYWTRIAGILAGNVGRLTPVSDDETPILRNRVIPGPNP